MDPDRIVEEQDIVDLQHQVNLKEEVIKELRRKIEVDEIQLKEILDSYKDTIQQLTSKDP